MMDLFIGVFIGVALAIASGVYCNAKYGYGVLAIVIYKAKYSKRFSWLACNVFGDDDWYYEKMYNNLVVK